MYILNDVNILYKDNYKPLKKEIEEEYRILKDILCTWIGGMNIWQYGYSAKSNLHVKHKSH
jgi:hypothetical protein